MEIQVADSRRQSISPLLSSPFKLALKRAFDLFVSAVALLLLLPVALLIALAIKLTSPGPIFYAGERIGRYGAPFKLYKFRSMYVAKVEVGPGITRMHDPRITRIGGWLRKTKLDELPQLVNILRGDMSLVGPRPEDPRYVAKYTPEQRFVLSALPGLTGLASLRYRNEAELLVGPDWEKTYIERVLPDKLQIERLYLEQWSLGLDMRILLHTLPVLPDANEGNLLRGPQ